MKASRLLVCVLVSIAGSLLAGNSGWAQDAPPRGGRGGNQGVLSPVELERWFDSYVLLQAQDTLQLTDGQFGRVLPALKALQGARRRHLQARRQALGAISGLLKSAPPDEAALRERLKGLRDLEAKARDDIQKAYDALDEVLDVRQQARFRLFEEQVERRKFDLLMKARQRAGDQAGPNRGR